ncbi:MAG: hypothetical protein KJ043_05425 [Anaerolineae bacterium]|nr:hypothetical protein [Anaerolineae bacterium]
MLTIEQSVALIQQAQNRSLRDIWTGYDISQIPFVVYDDDQMVFINHPNPPTERPPTLIAATSTDINGTETATIPVKIVGKDEQTLVPIAYHEGFHVYQHHHFTPIEPDFFTAMSYYPELNPDYRTLCHLEADVLRSDWDIDKKIRFLADLGRTRRDYLSLHESLLGYERFLDRSEGTAHYVEQQARQILYGISPQIGEIGHGLTRFYQVGAGLCWLIKDVVPDWMTRVEAGESLGDILLTLSDTVADLSQLGYLAVKETQEAQCETIRDEIQAHIAHFDAKGTLTIEYNDVKQMYRAFNPSTLTSLGDGRVLHRTKFKLVMPKYGSIACDETIALDLMNKGQLVIENVPYTYADGVLKIDTPHIQAHITHVEHDGNTLFRITEDA